MDTTFLPIRQAVAYFTAIYGTPAGVHTGRWKHDLSAGLTGWVMLYDDLPLGTLEWVKAVHTAVDIFCEDIPDQSVSYIWKFRIVRLLSDLCEHLTPAQRKQLINRYRLVTAAVSYTQNYEN